MANHFSYPSSHGNSNDQVMYTSNRSRSESGSSDSSRGSGNSGNSGNSGKPRRRSHRPRGCRGGSNRRRQKNGEGNKPYFKKTYNSDFKNRVQGKFSHPSMNENDHAGPSEEEFVKNDNKKNGGRGSVRRGSYNENSGKDYNIIIPDYTYPNSEISVSISSDLQPGANTYGHNPQAYYGSCAPRYGGESENDYPLLQSSFSESSSETIVEQRDVYAQSKHVDSILPPPPSDELFNRPNQILPGPNPYALNSFGTGAINNSNPVYVTHSYAAPTPAPAIVLPVSRPPLPHLVDSAPGMAPSLPGLVQQQTPNDGDFNYRAERLQKQRQNVVGGSLFVTSPRSFLMSCKRSFHE